MIHRRRFLTASAAALAASGLPSLSFAQTLQKNARIAVGFPPGGSTDFIARILADRMRGKYAPQILVENRPGAAGRVVLQQLRNAETDGSTMIVSPTSMFAIYPHVYRRLGYDAFNDFVPVCMVCSFPFGVGVGPAVPESVRTISDLAAWAKGTGKPINFGSPGAGSMPHFTGFSLFRALGVEAQHIGFKGGARRRSRT